MSGQDATESKHTTAQKENITAAGIVIYGTNRAGKRAFVMPYTEGRFGFGDKYYVLPKGKIDDGETPIQTAIRETEEETGISLEKLLGTEAKEQLAAGKEQKESINSPGYSGVRVVRVGLDPVIHTSVSQSHKGRTMALYGIEVEGIEKLASHLKNPENAATQDFKVKTSITKMVADKAKYPQLTDFLCWMRSGEVPDADWSRGKKIPEPLSQEDSKNFRRIEAAFMKNKKPKIITTREEWLEFCEKIAKPDYGLMSPIFGKIKDNLAAMNITKGDYDIIKFDEKDAPLHFFQEGADVITAEDYLKQFRKLEKESRIYANGFGGAKSADKDVPEGLRAKPKLTITRSQLAAVVPFVPVEELFEGLATGENGVRQVMSLLPCGNGWKDKHPDYWRKTVKTVDGVQEQSISKITAKPPRPLALARSGQSESRQSARR